MPSFQRRKKKYLPFTETLTRTTDAYSAERRKFKPAMKPLLHVVVGQTRGKAGGLVQEQARACGLCGARRGPLVRESVST